MTLQRNSVRLLQRGFGLTEVMVALLIGLISTLVIMQVVTNFEGQKRTTTGSADAQTNGSIALYTIQQQVQMTGFGLPIFSSQNQPLDCSTSSFDHDGDASTPSIGISPITIEDGGNLAGASDRIIVGSGTSPMGSIPVTVRSATGTAVGMDNNLGCAIGDLALIMNGSSCAMSTVTGKPDNKNITLASAPASLVVGASLTCMGGWSTSRFEIAGKQNLAVNGGASVAGIVNIQAQYGVSASPSDNKVAAWVNASGGTWGTPTINDRKRIKAIRVAVVARSDLLEKENVTNACSSLTDANPTGLCAWAGTPDNPAPSIDLSKNADGSDNPDWRRYRYRVFETVIPIRNLIWSNNTL